MTHAAFPKAIARAWRAHKSIEGSIAVITEIVKIRSRVDAFRGVQIRLENCPAFFLGVWPENIACHGGKRSEEGWHVEY